MKKIKLKRYIFGLVFVFGCCVVKNYVLAMAVDEITLHKGQSVFIATEHLQKNAVVTTENEEIASAANGVITAKSVGETLCKAAISASSGEATEEFYKIKVLPSKSVKYVFTEPNNPRCDEVCTISAMTDAAVERVKFFITTENGCLEKLADEKIPDGKNFIYKTRLKFPKTSVINVKMQVKIGDLWKDVPEKFDIKVFEESKTKAVERRASDKCVQYIMAKEGFKPRFSADAYAYAKNIYDIGYGNVLKAGEPFFNEITRAEAKALLLKRLNDGSYSKCLNNFIIKNNLELSQNQFDALLSFTYNLGVSWMNDSDLQRVILDIKNTNSKNSKSAMRSIGTVISDDGLRLRSQPSTQSKILKVMKFNEQVDVLSACSDGWCKVRTQDGREGFCFAEFLSVKNEYTKSNIGIVNSDNGLRLRRDPSLDSPVLKVLKFNEQVDVLDKNYNVWYKVKTNDGLEGFCFAKFLTIKPVKVEKTMNKIDFSKEILAYHNAGGRFVKGLLNRRIEELQMFFYNDYSTDGAKNKYNFVLPSCN